MIQIIIGGIVVGFIASLIIVELLTRIKKKLAITNARKRIMKQDMDYSLEDVPYNLKGQIEKDLIKAKEVPAPQQ